MSIKKKPSIFSSETIFQDTYLQVKKDVISWNGHRWNQVYCNKHHNKSVVIIAYDNKKLYLVRQYRHAIQQYIWQFPAGTYEGKGSMIHAAKRELEEEVGLCANKMKLIGCMYPEPGISTDITEIYLAQDLLPTKRKHDHSEVGMDTRAVSLNQLEKEIKNGKITCGITLSSFLLFRTHISI